jgi:hypothetical protein
MNNQIIGKRTLALIIAALAMSILAIISLSSREAYGSAPSGLPATIATSTLGYVMQTSQTLLVATSTNCAARVVTTRTQPAMLTFSDKPGVVPTAVVGHLQVASTTVAYDSGVYGCDAVRVISATLTTDTIDVSESR